MRLRQLAALKVFPMATLACLALTSTAVLAQVADAQGDFQTVPEPGTLALLAGGVAVWALGRWRGRK